MDNELLTRITFTMEGGWPTRKTYANCRIVRLLRRYCIVRIDKFADGRAVDIKVRTDKDGSYYDHEIRADNQSWRGDMFEKAKQLKVTDLAPATAPEESKPTKPFPSAEVEKETCAPVTAPADLAAVLERLESLATAAGEYITSVVAARQSGDVESVLRSFAALESALATLEATDGDK